MPMYDHHCPECGQNSTLWLKIAQLEETQLCRVCATPLQRRISAPRVLGDYSGYSCPITGKWIEGRRAHAENLAKHGCRVMESGEYEDAARFRRDSERRLDAAIERTVEEEIYKMPAEKRDALAADLTHFSADVVRG